MPFHGHGLDVVGLVLWHVDADGNTPKSGYAKVQIILYQGVIF